MIRLVGLDLSLTSTGIARLTLDDAGTVVGSHTVTCGRRLQRGATWQDRADRIRAVAALVADEVLPGPGRTVPTLIAVEAPAHDSSTPGAGEGHGLRWRVYGHLARYDAPLVQVVPQNLKLYATGDGRAPKTTVVQSIRRHYGDRFDLPLRKADGQEDVADAIALVAMAARSIGHPIDLDHPSRIRALKAPCWVNREDS